MSIPSTPAFARFLCRLYADGKVKPGTTFTYLAPADHRRRANGDGPDDGRSEPSGSSPQLSVGRRPGPGPRSQLPLSRFG